jgi:predicted esterase
MHGCGKSGRMDVRLLGVAAAVAAALAGCGGDSAGGGPPLLRFHYDASQPLGYVDRGRVGQRYLEIHDVSFRSGPSTVDGLLLLPPGTARRPAAIVVHGSGGDRTQLLAPASWLASRGVVTLTITAPSSTDTRRPASRAAALEQQRDLVVGDVVAVRRAVDVLRSLPSVDPQRIGYVGWSAGAKTGAFVAATEPRVRALALLSAGAAPLSEYVAAAPSDLKPEVERVLGSVDPLRYVAHAKPGTLLLADGRRDAVVPRQALQNMIDAAPEDTSVRWYESGHELSTRAYSDAIEWLTKKLEAG